MRSILIAMIFGIILPLHAYADINADAKKIMDSIKPLCDETGLCIESPRTGFGSIELYLRGTIIPVLRAIMVGVAVLYALWAALSLIVEGREESVLTEQKKTYGYMAFGLGIAGAASYFVETFANFGAAGGAPTVLVATPLQNGVNIVVDYISIVAGTFLVFSIAVAGFRIIALQGNDGEIDKQKKQLFGSLLGAVLLLLARIIVNAAVPVGAGGGGASSLVQEIAGMTRFLLEIFGGLTVISLMASGALFIISAHNDALKQRAKRMLLSTLVILLIIVLSYTIVSTFIR